MFSATLGYKRVKATKKSVYSLGREELYYYRAFTKVKAVAEPEPELTFEAPSFSLCLLRKWLCVYFITPFFALKVICQSSRGAVRKEAFLKQLVASIESIRLLQCFCKEYKLLTLAPFSGRGRSSLHVVKLQLMHMHGQ